MTDDNTTARQLAGKKAKYFTLGCKLNFAETATIERQLAEAGVCRAEQAEKADLCIINTCSVTETADHKARHLIHRAIRENPGAFIVVTGCYAQLQPAQIAAIGGVSLVLGAEEKSRLAETVIKRWADAESDTAPMGAALIRSLKPTLPLALASPLRDIRSFAAACARGERTRWWLKVQDGCDRFCSYCTIPLARGRSRSPSIASIVAQARLAAGDGAREIVLTGVNIGDFGRTTGESLTQLVRELDQIETIARYRISSLEPDLISDELIDAIRTSRAFMPHFHIPLQSGSDNVLRLMRRRYTAEGFAAVVGRCKRAMPEAFVGVDVMTGTRGETGDDFRQTTELLESLPVTELHVFPYSERPGTAALRIPHVVDEAEKRRRCQELIALSSRKKRAFYEAHSGREAVVLAESAVRGGRVHGFTDNYIRVALPPDAADGRYDNHLVRVRLGRLTDDGEAMEGDLFN